MYKNIEGYADPTAGAALGKVMRIYKQNRRIIRKQQDELKHRKKVYIVSPYAGDTEKNVKAAIGYCRFAIDKKTIPVASHLIYPQILDDNSPAEREIGTMYGLALLALCDEVWCFGKNISTGMKTELSEAKHLGKPIKYFNEEE